MFIQAFSIIYFNKPLYNEVHSIYVCAQLRYSSQSVSSNCLIINRLKYKGYAHKHTNMLARKYKHLHI